MSGHHRQCSSSNGADSPSAPCRWLVLAGGFQAGGPSVVILLPRGDSWGPRAEVQEESSDVPGANGAWGQVVDPPPPVH
jgi:hypothetical protein